MCVTYTGQSQTILSQIHFIFRHKNPKTGEYEEKHMNAAPSAEINKLSNLYTLVVRPDQTFELLINGESSKNGTLLEDFTPAVNPPKEIDDPNDSKPEDWVDEAKIADPEATKVHAPVPPRPVLADVNRSVL